MRIELDQTEDVIKNMSFSERHKICTHSLKVQYVDKIIDNLNSEELFEIFNDTELTAEAMETAQIELLCLNHSLIKDRL